ncbi:4-aminobutyrate--2-oxoglutarate transaminase [Mycobacterium xenopi]|uniref:(S)-3-amino-2-methylpropionate transaminase n=2 Tax=Mycobacterium xenopi TaxID=1789 RepID=A0AAD1H1I0_MYCXE|nr:4-aminobutyrate--2-oxoglutarate transaminase [Mycobacterium xenopi]MDA3638140.1 4-aminobutyrate--2-oxoglutarate transaminase [Mycobacterium xenopi]MDA3656208.1 4-aminobutyrate--2-oxoglutarate transaminase [Mycobacterium xenopi]MDA3664453.1 4-aminobutyrate--2-oxoglutarate transaminase [Mycobacterium xenopi]ORX09554.1 4-aminobutyrate aminotransferase [Mycobacterium xenopi]SPX88850.1 4-aminobutyrate aminotransferase [Mycobacterium xenopi]
MPAVNQSRHLLTEIPGPASLELTKRRTAAVARGVGSIMPVYAARASGGIVEDVDGNRLIDLGSGIAVTTIGNAAPRVVDAVRAQVAEFTHTCFMVTPYEHYVAVAEQLNRLAPGGGDKRSALFNSGAEAVENAIKVARCYTRKPAVVAFDHAYHGRTNLAMALTAKSAPYKNGFGPFAPEIYRAPLSYPFRDRLLDEKLASNGELAAERAIRHIDQQVGADNVAALLIEPIQGEGGFIVPAPGFLATLRQWCQQHNVVFIADEIQTGFARTGAMFACEHEGIEPDLVCVAKGIAGGLPLSAVTGRAEIMDAAHPGGLGGTFGGNPVACAAALASIATIESDGLIERARQLGELMTQRLLALQRRDDRVGDVRGRGAMMAIELVKPGGADPNPQLTDALTAAAHAAGVIVLTAGTFDNVVRLLPPLTISDELLTEGLDVIASCLAEL